jgi:cobalt/nickel transport system permease protein
MDMKKFILTITLMLAYLILFSVPGYSMHIAEGILSIEWVIVWFLVALPFVIWSIIVVVNKAKSDSNYLSVVALMGAVVLLMTSLAIPSPVAGSVSHPAATGISSIIVGPIVSVLLGTITLVIQALFMAHGGITSLGANITSMAIVGSFAGFIFFKLSRLIKLPYFVAGFFAGFFADIFTYLTTALQLALEIHGSESIISVWMKLFALFMPIQLPISVIEGIIAGFAIKVFIDRLPNYIDPVVEAVKK